MTSPPSCLQGDQDYRKQWNVTVAKIAAKETEIKQIAIDMEVDVGLLQIRLGNKTELTENEQLAMLKFTELQELKTEKCKLLDLLKPTEVYLLLFLSYAFRGKPV